MIEAVSEREFRVRCDGKHGDETCRSGFSCKLIQIIGPGCKCIACTVNHALKKQGFIRLTDGRVLCPHCNGAEMMGQTMKGPGVYAVAADPCPTNPSESERRDRRPGFEADLHALPSTPAIRSDSLARMKSILRWLQSKRANTEMKRRES